ncbi:MAG TPA: glycosyltransferase family 2 protein [Candidatus Binatus sp.]|nr:glycosyltransferase family 2 protein [Candidatus Binatus sp.]HKN12356.1 glycosyltransferase family 2 protein [Candidatus Binatus sp.]
MTGRGAVPGLGPRSEGDRDFASHTAANAKRLEESRVKLSIVIPIYNEAANLDEFFRRLLEVLERLAVSYEVVCVDDGSTDETLARLIERRARDPRLKILSLSRNFGKEVALSAGIEHSSGAAVIPIDCDLQDPPELIEEMVAQWRLGYDVVYATRHSRPGDGLAKRLSARMFYRLLDAVSEVPIPSDAGDFRLLDRRVVDALLRLPERSRFMKGLFAWVGFKQTELSFEREGRNAGSSAWTYWRLWNFALDGVTSFSSLPLKIWSYVGVVISLLAFAYALFLAVFKLARGINVPGYTSLMVVVLFLAGIQLITLGVIGEYLGRVYTEVKHRPLYLLREAHGFEQYEDRT